MRPLPAVSAAVALVAALVTPLAPPLTPAASTTWPGPNGLIAFVRGTSDCQDIYLRRDDGGTTKLTKCPRVIGAPAWSPNSKKLAVSYVGRDDNSLRPKIALIKAATGDVEVVSVGGVHANSPVFSSDGSVLAFAGGDAGDDNLAIYTVPVGGGTPTKLTGGSGEVNDEPDWSPGADVIAWAHKDQMSPTYDVWAMTVDASGHNPAAMTNLTNGAGNSRYPSWSSDGSRIAFASDRSGSWQIYVMNADGGNVVQVTTGGNHIEPAWSPDNTKIVFTTGCTTPSCATSGPNDHRVNGDLQVIDVSDLANPGAPQTILGTAAAEFDPQWARMCRVAGCPVTSISMRSVRLKPIHHLVAKGRVVGAEAPRACRVHVPLVLQMENVIDRGDPPNRHWIKEGSGRTTSTGRFRLHLPPRLTGWYRVKAIKRRIDNQVCAAAASRLRVNYFIRDPRGDNAGPVDIAWADASLRDHVVTFTVHTYTAFATRQKSTPCILFMKRMRDSHYSGSICFGGLAIHDELRPLTIRRPDPKTIVYRFKESELDPGFTNFEWGARSGVSDHDLYDILPSDFELGNPDPVFDAPDTPFFFKHKPTYHH